MTSRSVDREFSLNEYGLTLTGALEKAFLTHKSAAHRGHTHRGEKNVHTNTVSSSVSIRYTPINNRLLRLKNKKSYCEGLDFTSTREHLDAAFGHRVRADSGACRFAGE